MSGDRQPSDERFLVTGALGCIGAWTVASLVREGRPVIAFDLGKDRRRLEALMSADELAAVTFVAGDITDLGLVERSFDDHGITNVIHLAALQVPFCRADPPLGALVNVVGTVNLFEAVKRRSERMAPLVYTSSIGMFAGSDADPATGRLDEDADAHPTNHYGVFKLANEGTARIYWHESGVPSVGLRPLTVYGAGRDQGMTSGPTVAIAAAILGLPYTVAFGGRTTFQYAEDVARTLIQASRSRLGGARVFNLGGETVDMADWIAAIEDEVPEAAGRIAPAPTELPFPSDIEHTGVAALGPIVITPFRTGIRATAEIYRRLAGEGRLLPAQHGITVPAPPSPV
ncbi:MAG TPA: NAD(P)-dependent oxidoreductase [Candidatus Limnocylindrales bacterium]